MNFYYIVFEKHKLSPHQTMKSWVIRKTENDMDTVDGLKKEIENLEIESGCQLWILNWKLLRLEQDVVK